MSFTRTNTLIRLLALILTLSGCTISQPQNDAIQVTRVTESQSLDAWLRISRQTASLSPDQAQDALLKMGKPEQEGLSLFYFGALNQQLQQLDGWVQARDAFRYLSQSENLGENFRELARLRMSHNQDLINRYEHHRHLQQELADSILEREQLEKKIAALAELEAAMSNRKQQSTMSNNPEAQQATDSRDDGVQP